MNQLLPNLRHEAPEPSGAHEVDFTSQKVLTRGVEQGWADPEDPRVVDFTRRSSIFGEITIDYSGRPINPEATPDMHRGRGELGKWGVNNAADAVVIATEADGQKFLLLVLRASGELALPGGMVDDADASAKHAALRELHEEAGLMLPQDTPAETIFRGYSNDPRNTRNSWIETEAVHVELDTKPKVQADLNEVVKVDWHTLDEVRTLISQPGSLFASHADIIKIAIDRY